MLVPAGRPRPTPYFRAIGRRRVASDDPAVINRLRRLDARIVAILAIFLSLVAIALAVAYTVAQFVAATFQQVD